MTNPTIFPMFSIVKNWKSKKIIQKIEKLILRKPIRKKMSTMCSIAYRWDRQSSTTRKRTTLHLYPTRKFFHKTQIINRLRFDYETIIINITNVRNHDFKLWRQHLSVLLPHFKLMLFLAHMYFATNNYIQPLLRRRAS